MNRKTRRRVSKQKNFEKNVYYDQAEESAAKQVTNYMLQKNYLFLSDFFKRHKDNLPNTYENINDLEKIFIYILTLLNNLSYLEKEYLEIEKKDQYSYYIVKEFIEKIAEEDKINGKNIKYLINKLFEENYIKILDKNQKK